MAKNKEELWALRKDYQSHSLDIAEVEKDPIRQFVLWFEEAQSAEILEPNAMTLATCNTEGRPSTRIVLLKQYTAAGFVFYTNYNSRKGKELAERPFAALNFCWLELERQIRIEGKVSKLDPVLSERYFQSRPKGSQIGAWASPQSEVIESRKILEDEVNQLTEAYAGKDKLPKPPHWGGYQLEPDYIEFWQGRSSRLHDRVSYRKKANDWEITRLAP